MADTLETNNQDHDIVVEVKDEYLASNKSNNSSGSMVPTEFLQQLMAELIGTYLLMFTGFTSIVVNLGMDNILTFPGVAILWGLDVMVMVYAVGHISGAHFNPAVTIAFATCKKFAWKRVPAYICAQLFASTLASGTVWLAFGEEHYQSVGTLPAGSNVQSLLLEFVITFYLMFAVSGVSTDERATPELAGIAVGATVTVNSLLAGPISGASMNPARSLGPAIVSNCYTGIWVYIVGPIAGALAGCWVYNIVRLKDKPPSTETVNRNSSFRMRARMISSL
ncbi:aquaporin NIP1-1-like [Coffea eugenioides]|uniref:Aquaporin NIP1-1 n=1 Tax=Coffea arabica TaxID=13443 RepID=A0A6P6W3Z8_COFAR|nr:aquaporin NIP1-1-like [Coffea arabica]XP_027156802.1 aquaporin NIP1-1-like [Coffea eugenioides]